MAVTVIKEPRRSLKVPPELGNEVKNLAERLYTTENSVILQALALGLPLLDLTPAQRERLIRFAREAA